MTFENERSRQRRAFWALLPACMWIAALVVALHPAWASDHADPIQLGAPESNLTDLFFFPDGDRMIAIVDVRRALSSPGPYNLSPFAITLHFDLQSALTFDDAEDRARYGGSVPDPEGLRSTARIELRLNDDATLASSKVEGLASADEIRIWTGVRDDPFIFPRFFGKNVIATVLSIPMRAFPEGQQDFALWATVTRAEDGAQLDHVGRSNRTQLGRFDFLNPLPPSEHVAAIMKKLEQTTKIEELLASYEQLAPLASLYHFVLQLRKYDVFPDVMLYTTRFPAGFPNGRLLTDDVAALTCAQGDCDLQELSYAEGSDWPRKTINDKPFLDELPYLAEPWPDSASTAKPPRSIWPIVGGLIGIVVAILALTFWLGYRRGAATR